MSKNEYITKVNESAMQMILACGEGIRIIKTVSSNIESNIALGSKVLDELDVAEGHLINAHKIQTKIIQDSIALDKHDSTILFSHAQDTLMVTKSELSTLRLIVKLFMMVQENE